MKLLNNKLSDEDIMKLLSDDTDRRVEVTFKTEYKAMFKIIAANDGKGAKVESVRRGSDTQTANGIYAGTPIVKVGSTDVTDLPIDKIHGVFETTTWSNSIRYNWGKEDLEIEALLQAIKNLEQEAVALDMFDVTLHKPEFKDSEDLLETLSQSWGLTIKFFTNKKWEGWMVCNSKRKDVHFGDRIELIGAEALTVLPDEDPLKKITKLLKSQDDDVQVTVRPVGDIFNSYFTHSHSLAYIKRTNNKIKQQSKDLYDVRVRLDDLIKKKIKALDESYGLWSPVVNERTLMEQHEGQDELTKLELYASGIKRQKQEAGVVSNQDTIKIILEKWVQEKARLLREMKSKLSHREVSGYREVVTKRLMDFVERGIEQTIEDPSERSIRKYNAVVEKTRRLDQEKEREGENVLTHLRWQLAKHKHDYRLGYINKDTYTEIVKNTFKRLKAPRYGFELKTRGLRRVLEEEVKNLADREEMVQPE